MTMIVNQKLCTGCGICVRTCPNNAILLKEGKAFIDQTKCSSCQICADVCPTGALQVERTALPVIFEKSQAVDVVYPQTTNASLSERSSWRKTALALAGQYVLPRMVDIMGTLLERHLSPPVQERTSLTKNSVDDRPYRLHRQRRGRFSKSTQKGGE